MGTSWDDEIGTGGFLTFHEEETKREARQSALLWLWRCAVLWLLVLLVAVTVHKSLAVHIQVDCAFQDETPERACRIAEEP